ncbi:hypothetical protein MINTM005_51500 [Mycobacterium intracellulare]|uniref:Uncharacterized protein n=1 Tax=Mycobacterium intracellulare TaxID=1767 RepID=A0A7R7N0I9_MYCIT|nr:hypothetical protein MINTM005_51500 [Mycobacterium intracellulare]BCO97086.1 hypothetical protein MINTM016_50620 [Mycobacterium intracellulare]BCP02323.1 hypothetical protein MINTM018_50920 [Mycobacterium intracellulare]
MVPDGGGACSARRLPTGDCARLSRRYADGGDPLRPGYAALAIAAQTAVRRAMERNGIGSQPGRCRAS